MPFCHLLRIRYAETDQMGVAHHAAYAVWLEEARIEALRALGYSYRTLEEQGTMMPVVDLEIHYHQILRFDDQIEVRVQTRPIGPTRLRFDYELVHDGVRCATASVVVACLTRQGRPCRLPATLVATLAGQS